ncbi:HAMP domain-containing protein [Paenibacillus anaericanus]|uniref:HAMP domain-containing protein n=1 Tax=Paenibacillus anaericanus TaxID=170367 RepID=A0A433Y1G4_9BACL|nr:histidine kinase [Paenibacillus anaericanus]RUT41490.1 HAMP domain-containing protein [Paenibacillus anaericanus]
MLFKIKRNSIMVKMIIMYTIPFILLSLILSWNNHISTQNIQDNFITNMSHAFDQASGEINNRIDMAYDLTEMVSRNNKIIEFINDPYLGDEAEFLSTYLDSVIPIIKYATAFTETDDYAMRIYMVDDHIPESWPYFLRLNNQLSNEKLQAFIAKEDETQMWLTPSDLGLGPSSLNSDRNKYTLLSKLYSPAREMLGLVAVMVAEDSLLSTVEDASSSDNTQFLYHDQGITFTTTDIDEKAESEVLQHHLVETEPYFIYEQHLYLYKTFDTINQTFVYKVSLEQLNQSIHRSTINQLLLIVFSVLLLIVTCYFMFKMIFLRLNRIVSIMRKVINGSTSMRIIDNKQDELGQLAQDFNGLIEMNNNLIHRVVMKERLRKEAQIKALQYQINPHFIYNTLDIFRMKLIKERMFDTADRIADFGKILRYNLSDNTLHTTLKEEIELIQKYINLQSLSSSKTIQLDIEVTEQLKAYPVIKFLLQPIVENSIKYGKSVPKDSLCIQVHCYVHGQQVWIDIIDDGAGMTAEKMRTLNDQFRAPLNYDEVTTDTPERSIGLYNINSRLRLYYGESYFITIESKDHKYTKVQIKLPYE